MYCLHPDMAQSLFQELGGERHEDLLVNVCTLTDLLQFTEISFRFMVPIKDI